MRLSPAPGGRGHPGRTELRVRCRTDGWRDWSSTSPGHRFCPRAKRHADERAKDIHQIRCRDDAVRQRRGSEWIDGFDGYAETFLEIFPRGIDSALYAAAATQEHARKPLPF